MKGVICVKKEFKNKATKAINFFLDNVILILLLFLVTIEYMGRMNIPEFVENFICVVGVCLVVFVTIWRLFFWRNLYIRFAYESE